jgi:AbrB family looped-hinge helix DNA binding protein
MLIDNPMKEYSAIVTLLEKGKITIPQQIRDVLGANKGDYLEIKITKIEKQGQADTCPA